MASPICSCSAACISAIALVLEVISPKPRSVSSVSSALFIKLRPIGSNALFVKPPSSVMTPAFFNSSTICEALAVGLYRILVSGGISNLSIMSVTKSS